MSRRDIDYLRYIERSISHVQQWSDVGFEALIENDLRFEAVLRRLETRSDTVSHLSSDLKERHPDMPWRAIGDFRNRLAHGYLDIKPERIKDVIEIDLPILLEVVEREIQRLARKCEPNS